MQVLDYILAMTKSTTTDKVTEYSQTSVINYLVVSLNLLYCTPTTVHVFTNYQFFLERIFLSNCSLAKKLSKPLFD